MRHDLRRRLRLYTRASAELRCSVTGVSRVMGVTEDLDCFASHLRVTPASTKKSLSNHQLAAVTRSRALLTEQQCELHKCNHPDQKVGTSQPSFHCDWEEWITYFERRTIAIREGRMLGRDEAEKIAYIETKSLLGPYPATLQ